jgi:hypothetical protein
MFVILLVLLVIILLGGFGFAVHTLWIIAGIFFLFWLAGFAFAKGKSHLGKRWYRW